MAIQQDKILVVRDGVFTYSLKKANNKYEYITINDYSFMEDKRDLFPIFDFEENDVIPEDIELYDQYVETSENAIVVVYKTENGAVPININDLLIGDDYSTWYELYDWYLISDYFNNYNQSQGYKFNAKEISKKYNAEVDVSELPFKSEIINDDGTVSNILDIEEQRAGIDGIKFEVLFDGAAPTK